MNSRTWLFTSIPIRSDKFADINPGGCVPGYWKLERVKAKNETTGQPVAHVPHSIAGAPDPAH